MEKMAAEDVVIDGIFKPMQNGLLGFGGFSFTWKGFNFIYQ